MSFNNSTIDAIALENIRDYFRRYGKPTDTASEYMRIAYEKVFLLAERAAPPATPEEFAAAFADLQKAPLTYGDIRSLYG